MAAQFYNFVRPDSNVSCTLRRLVESKYFTLAMLAVVISNTTVMIFETYDALYEEYYSFFLISERVYLCIYIVECALKLWVYSWKFFKSLWNCFDLFIIGISLIDLISHELTYDTPQSSVELGTNPSSQTQFERFNHFLKVLRVLRVLRSFRALRVLRTIRFIQSIHTIVKTCSKALPAMASITFIMIIITCISAIMARSLFGEMCPENFSNLVKTIFSLFVLLTLDDWYSIYQECADRDYASFQLVFCLIYIFIMNFILLNLLMAVLVDSFQHTLDNDTSKNKLLETETNMEERISENLNKLMEEYCQEGKSSATSTIHRNNGQDAIERTSKEYQRQQSLAQIEKLMIKYYTFMESLEFRMERHEQLTKWTQKSLKLLLDEQDHSNGSLKR